MRDVRLLEISGFPMPNHTVKSGECLSGIAYSYGLAWDQIWNHPENAGLKEKRGDPNILRPGDVVFVPERTLREEERPTGKRHRFKRTGSETFLRLRLQRSGYPVENEPYALAVNRVIREGQTDATGLLVERIPPMIHEATLYLRDFEEQYQLQLGRLDPLDQVTGIQARLNNLGYEVGKVDGINGPITDTAVRVFQQENGLAVDGVVGSKTRNALREAYGC